MTKAELKEISSEQDMTSKEIFADIITETEFQALAAEVDEVERLTGFVDPNELSRRLNCVRDRLDRSRSTRIKRAGLEKVK